jgi:hypothetical protein
VVLGGDKTVGPPRSVEHAWQLRQMLRHRNEQLNLGGWANPYSDPERQVDFLVDGNFCAEFYLTQIVSHHRLEPVRRFLDAARRRNLTLPGIFGVFYYRSANARTLEALKGFLPVPAEELTKEFAGGASAIDVCARTVRALADLGVRHFYISNLPLAKAPATLSAILDQAGVASDETAR